MRKPLLSDVNIEKRHSFAVSNVDHPEEYWDDETKIMLFYNDGPSRVWRKPLSALEKQNHSNDKIWKNVTAGLGIVYPAVEWENDPLLKAQ